MINVFDVEFARVCDALIVEVPLRGIFAITSPKCGRRHLLAVIFANSDVLVSRWVSSKILVEGFNWTHVELLTPCSANLPALVLLHLFLRVEMCPSILATVYAIDLLFSIDSFGCFSALQVPADWIFIHLLVLVFMIDYAAIVFWPGVLCRDCAVVVEFGELCRALIFKQSISAGLKVKCRGH